MRTKYTKAPQKILIIESPDYEDYVDIKISVKSQNHWTVISLSKREAKKLIRKLKKHLEND